MLKLKKEVDLNIFPPVCLPSARLDETDIAVWITGQTREENIGIRELSQTCCRLGAPGGKFICYSRQAAPPSTQVRVRSVTILDININILLQSHDIGLVFPYI